MSSDTPSARVEALSGARCSTPDKILVAAILRGEERAFNEFFNTYFSRVYRFALPRLNRDSDAAKEVVQATLVKGLRNLPSFRFDATLFTWLCQICRRKIVDYVRVNNRFRNSIVLINDHPQLREALESIEAPANSDPQHVYSTEEKRQLIRSILDHLPERYGDVLEWKYIEGHSVEEIGERLGMGHGAAQSLLSRARAAFRQAVETVFGSTADDILAGLH
jgi:RNA polymerase sigma-70 factor (ECF subfamily)